MKAIRCPQCALWTDGDKECCAYCRYDLHQTEQQAAKIEAGRQFRSFPVPEIHPDDPYWRRGAIHVLRFFQLIFTAFISLIGAIASSTVH